MKEFYFFCDGATEPTNPGPSAFATVQLESYHDNHEIEHYSEYIGIATNNIAELLAIKSVLDNIINNKDIYLSDKNNVINIFSDSTYALDCITDWYPKWIVKNKLKDKKNLEIIIPAYENYKYIQSKCVINLSWVKGHSGVFGNERADELCSKAIEEALKDDVESRRESIYYKVDSNPINRIEFLKTSLNSIKKEYDRVLTELKELENDN